MAPRLAARHSSSRPRVGGCQRPGLDVADDLRPGTGVVAVHLRAVAATHGGVDGIDQLSGGSFYCDPFGWVLRDDVPVTNPNIFQFAKPGTGKSGTTKSFCNRMMPFGYRTLILGDPKDEYEALCRATAWNRSSSAPA